MIVIDASAMLELLLRTPAGANIERRLFTVGETVHAPHLIDVEVTQVLQRYALRGDIVAMRGLEALDDLEALSVYRYPHEFLLPRVWELRDNLTVCDAVYLALAETLGAPLITSDRRLAAVAGVRARIELV